MYLRKSIKSFELIFYRQKCLNWCQIVTNRRYLSEDKTNEEKGIEKVDQKSEVIESRKSDDKVIVAKENLNQLIHTLKSKTVFGESDSKLKELLAKPVVHIRRSARKEEVIEETEDPINEISAKIDERLVLAAKGIAKTLSGKESKDTENDLLRILKIQVIETNLAKEGKLLSKEDLASLLGDMKVTKEETETETKTTFRPEFMRRTDERVFPEVMQKKSSFDSFNRRRADGQDLGQRGRRSDRREEMSISQQTLRPQQRQTSFEKIDLFSGDSLGVFEADMKEATDLPKLRIWDRLMDDELQTIVARPPMNAFEEMIEWTENGKLWKYPINNEQGLEEEAEVPFYEHVLLDHLLEGFPERGPVRKFMELVIMGLSSNPYITVGRKEATVEYYRQYFREKEDILQLSGALG